MTLASSTGLANSKGSTLLVSPIAAVDCGEKVELEGVYLDAVARVAVVGRFRNANVRGEWRTGNAVLFCCPCSQVRDLTTFRTEWAPGVSFPRGWLATGRAQHESCLALRCLLGFLDLSPCILERNGPVKNQCLG
jgi:hypothetical protein